MASSIWRLAHLALAAITFVFLLIASVTGAILAFDSAGESFSSSQTKDFGKITLAESIPALKKKYADITSISVDANSHVKIQALDDNGEEVNAFINPITGNITTAPAKETDFIKQVKSLHRSLFLHETGRFIVGVVSCLLLLILLSGIVLIARRQNGWRHFFATVRRDFFAQFFHVFTGRLTLLPLLVTAVTGSVLFMIRFKMLPEGKTVTSEWKPKAAKKEIADFPAFKKIKLGDVEKVEFPFAEDPEEFYIVKLKDRELRIDQFSGELLSEKRQPYKVALSNLSLDLHTGRTNGVWALVLGLAALSILGFMWSGFVITFRRYSSKIKNKYRPEDAEFIILYGSENGSTAGFAQKIHRQILAARHKSFITDLNNYRSFPNAVQILVFTSTYGLGDAPDNAKKFLKLLQKTPQSQAVAFSVVGFGSHSYEDFCAFGKMVDAALSAEKWAQRFLDFHTVNDRSADDFVKWAQAWEEKSGVALVAAPDYYREKITNLQDFHVISNDIADEANQSFRLVLRTRARFQSGDLLAIYPAAGGVERFYSIGKVGRNLQLIVRRHPHGIGSGFLKYLQPGQRIRAKIVANSHFHFNKNWPSTLLISNGTGIAPFLGMIEEAANDVHLLCGFRKPNGITDDLARLAESNRNLHLHTAFSRSENPQYVSHLLRENPALAVEVLSRGGRILLCGSLSMQRDVEAVLEEICAAQLPEKLEYYRENDFILSDCY